jgi:ABC-2 type transport system ATP-binding protein
MLIIKDLHFSYGNTPILKGVDLEIKEGKITGILGLNGAGKTTLFRNISAHYFGQKNEAITWKGKMIDLSMISFLETENYFFPYTKGIEYLQLLTEMKANSSEIYKANELFDLPLEDLIDSYSTGMRKKIAFLGCLLQKREILLLDEPFNGIDLESSERLFLILKKLRSQGKTIILSSHILSSLTAICDEIVHVSDGKVLEKHDKKDFEAMEKNIRSGIAEEIEKHLDGFFI